MRRRDFIALLSGAAAWPIGARAQAPAQPVIGFLNIASPAAFAEFVAAFHKGLNAGGYAEGRNVVVEYRWAEGNYDRLREQAADLVRRRVNVIVATGGLVSASAAQAATSTIPILNIFGIDPVGEGLVASVNRPGGNFTGITFYGSELIPKRLQLMRELMPQTVKFALLLNPKTPSAKYDRRDSERAAAEMALDLLLLEATEASDLKKAFDQAAEAGVGALLVSADGFFTSQRDQIIALATSHKLPVGYPWRQYVSAGGLMSYGPVVAQAYFQIGEYASRILKGDKAAELPVQMPTKLEMLINLKTAKALNLTVPRLMLARADEVIE